MTFIAKVSKCHLSKLDVTSGKKLTWPPRTVRSGVLPSRTLAMRRKSVRTKSRTFAFAAYLSLSLDIDIDTYIYIVNAALRPRADDRSPFNRWSWAGALGITTKQLTASWLFSFPPPSLRPVAQGGQFLKLLCLLMMLCFYFSMILVLHY